MKTRALVILAVLAAVGLGLILLLALFQRKLIYVPLDHHVPEPSTVLPGAESVTFSTEDGLELHGWFLPAEADAPVVLVCNGNAGNRSYRAPLARALADLGFAVLLFDYRGYAENPGRPSEEGVLADARAARGHLLSRGFPSDRIVYFGESLGAAVAVGLAADHAPAALVLRSPFTSMPGVAKVHYPFLPVDWLLVDRFPSIERIRRVDCPLLVVAGAADRIVPASLSQELFAAAPGPAKRYVVIPGARHNDLELTAGPALLGPVADFLATHVAREDEPAAGKESP